MPRAMLNLCLKTVVGQEAGWDGLFNGGERLDGSTLGKREAA